MRTTRAITNACFIRRTTPMSASSGKWLGALSSFSNLLLEATVTCPNAKKNASHTIIQQRQYHSRRYLSNEKKIAEDTTTTTTTTTTNDMESMTITIQEPDKVEEKEGPEIDRSKYTHVVKFKLPDMDQGDGKVTKWYKAEGDLIHRKETICEIELEVNLLLGIIVFICYESHLLFTPL